MSKHIHEAMITFCMPTITAFPLVNWRRPPGHPHTMWMKTTQQDLESLNLSLNKAI